MLSIKLQCEGCDTSLPNESDKAYICSFECTYCKDCVEKLENICPACGGGFERRPVRPAELLKKYPPQGNTSA